MPTVQIGTTTTTPALVLGLRMIFRFPSANPSQDVVLPRRTRDAGTSRNASSVSVPSSETQNTGTTSKKPSPCTADKPTSQPSTGDTALAEKPSNHTTVFAMFVPPRDAERPPANNTEKGGGSIHTVKHFCTVPAQVLARALFNGLMQNLIPPLSNGLSV